jgi:hypothetical protein
VREGNTSERDSPENNLLTDQKNERKKERKKK